MSLPSITPATTSAQRAEARDRDHRPPLSRLTAVELRKMLNTRSGIWVTLGVGAVTVIFALVNGLAHGGRDATYTRVLHDAAQPSAYLLPLLGVLLICGEWTQRTTLTTFALVPDRRRVLAAKAGAGLITSTAAWIVTLAVSAALTAAFSHAPGGPGTLPATVIAQSWLLLISWMLVGLAFGMALLTTVPAIIAYLLLPIAWAGIASTIHSLSGATVWLDVAHTLAPLTLNPLSATQWTHLVTALAIWIGLPLVVGLWRIRRTDLA
jgi:ABC-2 type transport system permease protein